MRYLLCGGIIKKGKFKIKINEEVVLCQYLGHEKSNFFMIHFWLIIHIDLESCN